MDYYGYSVGDFVDPTYGQAARTYYLSALAELRPLADCGAIGWFDVTHEDPEYGLAAQQPKDENGLASLAREFENFPFDLTGLRAASQEFRVLSRPIFEQVGLTWEQFIIQAVMRELDILSPSFLGFGQPYFRYPLIEQVVNRLLTLGVFRSELSVSQGIAGTDVDSFYTRRLVSLDLPSFDELDIATMAELRRSEDGIDRWRVGLREALNAAMAAPSHASLDGVQRLFEERMAEEGRRLHDRTKRGSLSALGSAASRSLTFGLVGGLAGASMGGDIKTSTVSGMASGVTRAVYEWQSARRSDRTDRLLLMHYGIANRGT